MGFLDFLGTALKPISDIVDELHTSDEERAELKRRLFQLQAELYNKTLEYEKEVLQAKASVIRSEANGHSWLQRNWRPITMLTFLVLVVADTMGLTHFRLSEEAWTLLQIGLGGYVVGRSAEKIAPVIRDMTKGSPVDGR